MAPPSFTSGDNHLSGAVIVGGSHDAVHAVADFLNLLVGQSQYGGHGRGLSLASLLHGLCALRHELQTLLEAQRTGCYQRGELAEAVAGHHRRLEVVAKVLGQQYAVKEYGRPRHLGLLQVLLGSVEHQVCDAEAKDLVGFLKQIAGFGIVVVQVLAHSHKLGTLARKYIRFHYS